MTGWNRLTASIASLAGYQNPFHIARRLLEMQFAGDKVQDQPASFNFLVADGAGLFAETIGAQKANNITKAASGNTHKQHDTVGCIAFSDNKFAVGTSTSGTAGKFRGRVGDTPLPGTGFIATPRCAAFCTWTGEVATRLSLPAQVDAYLKACMPLGQAVHTALASFHEVTNGKIGGVNLYVATATECAAAGIGFENNVIDADYTYWREDMKTPLRLRVPAWKSNTTTVSVF